MGFEKFGLVSYASQTRVEKFVDYLADGKIYGTKCKECGFLQFPPRSHCSRCLSTNYEWKQLSQNCTLISFTKVDAAPAAFNEQAPYLIAVAEFSEGPKIFARIDKKIAEEQLTLGMKMEVKTAKLANGNLSYILTKPTP